jgi:AcrR family transcriptional regulator
VVAVTAATEGIRTRDPGRRERILQAAAALVVERGFHSVSMSDIGGAAGIVGSGVYRHFESKAAVLLALLDDGMTRLLDNAATVLASARPDVDMLEELVRDQVRFVMDESLLVRLWQAEVRMLPDDDQRRLRRMQRHYIEEWVHVLRELRPELTDSDARVRVHIAIGAIQSAAMWNAGMARSDLAALLSTCAQRCLDA